MKRGLAEPNWEKTVNGHLQIGEKSDNVIHQIQFPSDHAYINPCEYMQQRIDTYLNFANNDSPEYKQAKGRKDRHRIFCNNKGIGADLEHVCHDRIGFIGPVV